MALRAATARAGRRWRSSLEQALLVDFSRRFFLPSGHLEFSRSAVPTPCAPPAPLASRGSSTSQRRQEDFTAASGRRHLSAGSLSPRANAEGGDSSSTAVTAAKYEYLRVEVLEGGAVGLVTLARPKALNALSSGVLAEVVAAFTDLGRDTSVGAIVITGEGKAFAAGADIKEMADQTFVTAYMSSMLAGWEALAAIKTPTIAAVNGFALGGGCELALMCDIILAGEKALFGQPEVKLGVIPGMGGTQRLIREVGKSRAMEMILTGERFMDAQEAAQRGLASRVVRGDHEALLAEAVALGKSIAALSRPAVALAKDAVNSAYETGLREGLRKERILFHATYGLGDQKEGMHAFLEKRAPDFKHQ